MDRTSERLRSSIQKGKKSITSILEQCVQVDDIRGLYYLVVSTTDLSYTEVNLAMRRLIDEGTVRVVCSKYMTLSPTRKGDS